MIQSTCNQLDRMLLSVIYFKRGVEKNHININIDQHYSILGKF